ncbi:SpoIIE family protein phosphatase [Streptomyces sp. NPDC057235]|uniref:SpoIIE family protein phosphatase n=1 Tax=Streptomyces sp. NPDC057235 TaxID=3346058 RepID=UPI003630DDCB
MSPARALDPKLFDATVAAVALFAGPDHLLFYVNAAYKRMLGARPLRRPAREAYPEPAAERFLSVLDDVLTTGRPRQLTESLLPAPGGPEEVRYFVSSCTPVATPIGDGVLVVTLETTAETRALQRFEALVTAVSQMVWVVRANGHVEEIVPGWEKLTGTPLPDREGEDMYAHIHPRDRQALVDAWRSALARRPPEIYQNTFRLRTVDGSYRHMATRCVPIVRDGRADEWIAATVDIEDTWGAELREHLLARVAQTSGGGLDAAFAAVADSVVPDLTDACVILLLSHEEWPLPEHATVTARRVASATRPGLPPAPAPMGQSVTVTPAMREVLESREPRTFRLPVDGRIPPGLVPEVTERWLAASGATSMTLVPLVVDDIVLGYATAATSGDTPVPEPADVELLREVLHHAQRPIRKVLDLQQARRTALRLQRAQLTRPPEVPGAVLAARYQPASPANEIGGDWYDAITLPDGTVVLDIGDVAGHDLGAATVMGQMRSMLRGLAWNKGPECTPAAVLAMLDDAAEGLDVGSFTTVVHTHLYRCPDGTWRMTWSNAGHPPPLLIPARGEPRFLEGGGEDLPLCVAPGLPRTTHAHALAPGDTLLQYTDGLIETPGTSLDTGQSRLLRAAALHRDEDLPDLLRLLQDLSDHRDDTAMIAFRAEPVVRGG